MNNERRSFVIYTAGPYRDSRGEYWVRQNIRAAEEMTRELLNDGFSVICPHKNTEGLGGAISDEDILAHCYQLLSRCDAVVGTRPSYYPTFRNSTGTQSELALANQLWIPVISYEYYTPDAVVDAINEARARKRNMTTNDLILERAL